MQVKPHADGGGGKRRGRPRARRGDLNAWVAQSPTCIAADEMWTAAHEAFALRLVEMGFGPHASRRAVLRVGLAPSRGAEAQQGRIVENAETAQIVEAVSWLASDPEGADEPFTLPQAASAPLALPPPCPLMPPASMPPHIPPAHVPRSSPPPQQKRVQQRPANRWSALPDSGW